MDVLEMQEVITSHPWYRPLSPRIFCFQHQKGYNTAFYSPFKLWSFDLIKKNWVEGMHSRIPLSCTPLTRGNLLVALTPWTPNFSGLPLVAAHMTCVEVGKFLHSLTHLLRLLGQLRRISHIWLPFWLCAIRFWLSTYNRPRKTWSECVKTDVNKCGLAGIDPLGRDAWWASVRHSLVLPTL